MGNALDALKDVLSMSPEEQDKYFHSLPPDKTSTLLVEDLERHPPSKERDEMIKRAKAFGYDDFKFTMMYDDCICPKMKLDEDARNAGFMDIVGYNMGGKYD